MGSVRRFDDPERANLEQCAEALKVPVVMEDVYAGLLRCDTDRQVSERKPVRSVGPAGGKVAHRRKHAALDRAINCDLPETFQRSIDHSDRLVVARVDHQLVSDRPAPRDVATLDLPRGTAPALQGSGGRRSRQRYRPGLGFPRPRARPSAGLLRGHVETIDRIEIEIEPAAVHQLKQLLGSRAPFGARRQFGIRSPRPLTAARESHRAHRIRSRSGRAPAPRPAPDRR